jgi:hypothetical protein
MQEPSIITYYRWEIARGLHAQGFGLEEIAQRVDTTPDEVKEWLDGYARRDLEWKRRLTNWYN